ncbi:hypothetical protein PHLCEN_2v6116 [Hermanssonia centrifuga]|uniref:Protein kinase domain-containing protein n=1 Tax=Hermanssonia centrifuga TaxID=98765 RepID=A0A2R6P102_9APHY|nr:hypothetical protein PHLCEN_2v6116 [Hermanssonia centrifuga]
MIIPKTQEQVKVTLGKPIFTQYGIVGRRTFLYRIKTDTVVVQTPLVIKFSYQVITLQREQELVEVALKAGVKHIPKVHMWSDLWKLSEGARAIFHDDNKNAYEDKMLRALVYTRYIPLKALFKTAWHLIPYMADQILDCMHVHISCLSPKVANDGVFPIGLHDLRYKANILHRDISANNVMFEIRDGVVNFILIDYDLATMVDPDGEPLAAPSSKHRTGTLPFMAHELLDDMSRPRPPEYRRVTHRLRHDFESLFYLCLYCIFTMIKVEDEKRRMQMHTYVREWQTGSLDGIASIKHRLCADVSGDSISELVFPAPCEALRPWFLGWTDVFSEGYLALAGYKKKIRLAKWNNEKSPPGFDIDTLQGTLTRDTIKESLRLSYDRPLRPEELQVANIPDFAKDIEPYMIDDEDLEEHVQKQGSVAEKAMPARKLETKLKKAEVAKKTVTETVAATKKTTTAKIVSPIRKQSPKRVAHKPGGVLNLAAATRNMTTRSMQKGPVR